MALSRISVLMTSMAVVSFAVGCKTASTSTTESAAYGTTDTVKLNLPSQSLGLLMDSLTQNIASFNQSNREPPVPSEYNAVVNETATMKTVTYPIFNKSLTSDRLAGGAKISTITCSKTKSSGQVDCQISDHKENTATRAGSNQVGDIVNPVAYYLYQSIPGAETVVGAAGPYAPKQKKNGNVTCTSQPGYGDNYTCRIAL